MMKKQQKNYSFHREKNEAVREEMVAAIKLLFNTTRSLLWK